MSPKKPDPKKTLADAKPAKAKTPADAKGVKPTAPKQAKAKAAKPAKPKKLSALDAAHKVLTESGQAMTTREMIEAMAAKGYWSSPNGQTPSATLYSAILRQLSTKGKDARFKKTARGKFAATGAKE